MAARIDFQHGNGSCPQSRPPCLGPEAGTECGQVVVEPIGTDQIDDEIPGRFSILAQNLLVFDDQSVKPHRVVRRRRFGDMKIIDVHGLFRPVRHPPQTETNTIQRDQRTHCPVPYSHSVTFMLTIAPRANAYCPLIADATNVPTVSSPSTFKSYATSGSTT